MITFVLKEVRNGNGQLSLDALVGKAIKHFEKGRAINILLYLLSRTVVTAYLASLQNSDKLALEAGTKGELRILAKFLAAC